MAAPTAMIVLPFPPPATCYLCGGVSELFANAQAGTPRPATSGACCRRSVDGSTPKLQKPIARRGPIPPLAIRCDGAACFSTPGRPVFRLIDWAGHVTRINILQEGQ